MQLESNKSYRILGHVDISYIAKRIKEIDEELWFSTHPSQTENIPLINKEDFEITLMHIKRKEMQLHKMWIHYNEDDWIPNRLKSRFGVTEDLSESGYNEYIKKFKYNIVDEQLSSYTSTIISDLEKQLNGCAGRVFYARLIPDNKIPPDIVPGYYMTVVHRLHIPIITNNKIQSVMGNEILNMESGVIYEINTQVHNGVLNLSTENNIYLVIDIIPKDKMPVVQQ